jgi:5-methylcytosine-specific restriction endonuclease McrA
MEKIEYILVCSDCYDPFPFRSYCPPQNCIGGANVPTKCPICRKKPKTKPPRIPIPKMEILTVCACGVSFVTTSPIATKCEDCRKPKPHPLPMRTIKCICGDLFETSSPQALYCRKCQTPRTRWKRVLIHKFGFVCWYCGMRLRDSILEIDHIRPRSTGGSDEEANLALACCFCNQAKKARTLKELLKWLKGIQGREWCPITDGPRKEPPIRIFSNRVRRILRVNSE